jgi:hypothetical protein
MLSSYKRRKRRWSERRSGACMFRGSRGLNPCHRLERSVQGVSSNFEQGRTVVTGWANAFGRLWLALSI